MSTPAPLAAAGLDDLHVLFRVGDADYAVAAGEVEQMESFAGATPVPNVAPWVVGLVQIRGRVVPVVDLRLRFGLPPAPRALDARIIVVGSAGRVVGLLVDTAREVARIDAGRIGPPPSLVAEQTRGFVRGVAQVGKRLVLIVDAARIIGEEPVHAG